MAQTIVVDVGPDEWESIGGEWDPSSRLLCRRSLAVAGCMLHLEAIAVDGRRCVSCGEVVREVSEGVWHDLGGRNCCADVRDDCPACESGERHPHDGSTPNGHEIQLNAEWDDDLADLHRAFGADGRWQVAEIEGREYAVFASPHC